jgi:hypothetical protein
MARALIINTGFSLKHSWLTVIVFFFIVVSSLPSLGQLSPGPLSSPHTKLEGLKNCTQCHTIGDKVTNQKCLSCHIELNARISVNKGFHVSSTIKGKDCITCHSEHHGLKFEMVRFDKKTFNHNQTGYELKGKHKVIDCRQCHAPDNIAAASLKTNTNTYLGLDPKCTSCHDDYHQKTLSQSCTNCHDYNTWKPASAFNHNNTDFDLIGAHRKVACAECHQVETRAGKTFQKFADVPHKSCTSCHKDQHNGRYGNQCKACHSEESFKRIVPSKMFNHSVTGYALEGRHKTLDCAKCHDGRNAVKSFGEFSKIPEVTCISCHKDVHEGKFGQDCKSCHNQNSFNINNVQTLEGFNHGKTVFPLIGKHQNVDCRKCHVSDNMTTSIAHNRCTDCHKDHHNGEFEKPNIEKPDCRSCHDESGFSPSTFTINQHQKSRFPLDGAHLATPCFACHMKDNRSTFINIGNNCVDCHQDIHQAYIDPRFYPDQQCKSCHTTEIWSAVTFDHDVTDFKLEGKHQRTDCAACHFDRKSTPYTQKFKDLPSDCNNCHTNIHGSQFAQQGVTDCSRCHGFESWTRNDFNHDNTKFKLTGEHAKVACEKCHKQTQTIAGKSVRVYTIQNFECKSCHGG